MVTHKCSEIMSTAFKNEGTYSKYSNLKYSEALKTYQKKVISLINLVI